jgi:hypothetical protein
LNEDLTIELRPFYDRAWQLYLQNFPHSLFHSPRWINLLQASYPLEMGVVTVSNRDGLVGGMPYAEVLTGQARRVTLPFSDFCPPLGNVWSAIDNFLASGSGDMPWIVKASGLSNNSATTAEVVGAQTSLTLDGDLRAKVHPKHRAWISKGERKFRSSFEVSKTALSDFYNLHSILRKEKFHLVPQGASFFSRLFDTQIANDAGWIALASYEHSVVAAMVCLAYGDSIYYKYSASDQSFRLPSPVHFLLHRCTIRAKDLGFRCFDFGFSAGGDLVRFKERFGARSTPVYRLVYGDLKSGPELLAVEKQLQKALEPSAPLADAQRAGETFYHFFA